LRVRIVQLFSAILEALPRLLETSTVKTLSVERETLSRCNAVSGRRFDSNEV